MSKFLRVLQKAGLVEIDEATQMADTPADFVAPEPPPLAEAAPPPPEILPEAESRIQESRAFEALYAERGVPPSPFPAEKLLKLLDGLRAMDPATRKTAVLAMDAADEAWTIDDAALDASRKIKALNDTKTLLAQQAASAAAHAQEKMKAREQRQGDAVAAIRKQIADLEALMQREVEKGAGEKAALEAQVRTAGEACQRECARIDTEIARLKEVLDTFVPPATITPAAGKA
ncbi:MAG TPA: hypothetical protein VJM11_21290 [Nevskiaceae bacterium]|nr:hypothetical protein [Nevskiaceae bacterium]